MVNRPEITSIDMKGVWLLVDDADIELEALEHPEHYPLVWQ